MMPELSLVAGVLGGSLPSLTLLLGGRSWNLGGNCLPWVSLLVSRVWYYQKKCHLLPIPSILFWCQRSSAFSSIPCPFSLHAYLLCLAALVPWTHHLCHSTHLCLLLWGSHCSRAYVTHLWMRLPSQWQNTQRGLFHFHSTFIFRCRASCPD